MSWYQEELFRIAIGVSSIWSKNHTLGPGSLFIKWKNLNNFRKLNLLNVLLDAASQNMEIKLPH